MANMFKCTLASGEALILTVTTDSTFAGQTITCTDGTTTLTQICPSTSPYTVEFKIPNGGTWTISSGTVSTSVTIPSSAELHDIPNGSTVTPINNIQIWLHCANIWDKNYTTISQVLADASTLQALIASTNAVDYMARSTTWATDVCADSTAMSLIGLDDNCADTLLANSTWLNAICNSTYFESVLNVKVPTMTSNTTPSGVVSALNYDSSNNWAPYKAFDSLTTSNGMWKSNKTGNNTWLQYKFENEIMPFRIAIYNYSNETQYWRALKFNILGSKNGTDFETITNELTSANERQYHYFNLNNNNLESYKYIRLVPTQYNYTFDSSVAIQELQIYCRAAS